MKTVRVVGNNMLVILDDGTQFIALPTAHGIWIGGGSGGGGGGGEFIWPFPVESITSEYMTPERPTHYGIDFAYSGIGGDPIPSAAAGIVVVRTVLHSGFGNYVIVETAGSDGKTLRHLYAHMQDPPPVNVGDSVAQGQTLGHVGNTGASQGNHLHWETRIDGSLVNPRDFMAVYG